MSLAIEKAPLPAISTLEPSYEGTQGGLGVPKMANKFFFDFFLFPLERLN